MIEIAAILAAAVRHWEELGVIIVLLMINGGVSFWHEHKAANAIEALKQKLALEARVIRDGRPQSIGATQLVPGDIIELEIGHIVPSDIKLLEGQHLSVDESALIGESLPVSREGGDPAYAGTTVKQGEGRAVVTATGRNTRFARTVELIETAEELGVITRAVEEARRIFQRMISYATYRITETIRLLLFIAISVLAFDYYPVTPIMIVLLAILNDIPIIAIAWDNARAAPQPVRWNMPRVLTIASVLGLGGVGSSFLVFWFLRTQTGMADETIQTMIFLKLLVAGHMTIFLTRNEGWMWDKPYPSLSLFLALEGTQVAGTLVAVYGLIIEPVGWGYAAAVWGYAIVWMLVLNSVKVLVYRKFLDRNGEKSREASTQPA